METQESLYKAKAGPCEDNSSGEEDRFEPFLLGVTNQSIDFFSIKLQSCNKRHSQVSNLRFAFASLVPSSRFLFFRVQLI